MGDFKKQNVFQERQDKVEDNIISMKKSHFNIYITLAIIAVISIFDYAATFKSNHSYESKYFEGYQMGVRFEQSESIGFSDGSDYVGNEPTANELLSLATDSYEYDIEHSMKEEDSPEAAGFQDGYLSKYMSEFIKTYNRKKD